MSRNVDVQSLFCRVAHAYDFLNHLFSLHIDRHWRAVLVRAAKLRSSDRVLDLCTGTADLAIGLARRLERGHVTGVDFSPRMLERGRRKIARRRLEERITLVRADAQRLPFPDRRFDAVGIAFGLRNLADRRLGLREMVRVLRPGGRLLVLEFSPPPAGWLGRLYAWYLGRFMPAVGGAVSGSEPTYRYLYSSIVEFLTPPQVRALMEEAGLAEVASRRLAGGIAYLHLGLRPGLRGGAGGRRPLLRVRNPE